MCEEIARPIQAACKITSTRPLTNNLFEIIAAAPELAARAKPGQFIHITCGENHFLRRPLSICDVVGNSLRLVFQVKGEGTRWLSQRLPGDTLDALGTLGNGFRMSEIGARPAFVGGGIGVPPLLMAMKAAKAQGAEPVAILGFRNRGAVILEADFQALGSVCVTTDDGSYGMHGLTCDVLECRRREFTAVCACGPRPMLHAAAKIAESAGLPCQVSMEERMGCGIGACLVCACALKNGQEETRYGHVCKDGPVFDAKEVVWP